ncbi:MAG: GspH/FimT family pseudopilin [Porticoccaceae bacterium]|nr:GspH/FimT family pseudopilin [Porticoccaceae bacterium]
MNSCLRTRVCNGFTLIELLITLSILAVLLGIGMPSLVSFINNNQMTSQANDLVYSVHMARSEAIKRGAKVRVATINGSWNNGWTVQADTNNDGDYLDVADNLMQWDPLTGGSTMAMVATNAPSNLFVPFNSRGAVVPGNASFVFTLIPDDCDLIESRIVSIQSTGRSDVNRGDCS